MSGAPGNTVIGASGQDEFAAAQPESAGSSRRRQLERLILLGALLLCIAVYLPTFISMAQIWLRSDTFLHGILIFPISGYLVWRRWSVLRSIEMQPFLPGLALILLATMGWLLADTLSVQVARQFVAVALLPLLVLTVAGIRFARAIAFPLGYLVFAVPFGEGLIPYLIEFTAFFTVEALEITGIPVYREGQFFSIPVGNFEVAKACSGIRYLLASLALGTLYGYLIYSSLRKRLAFFAFALLLPIFANGLRAYGIVLIAHLSSMRLAVGLDHIIFGWVFFGLVMLLMFWVGDIFRDRPIVDAALEQDTASQATGTATRPSRIALVATLSLLVLAAGPVLSLAVPTTGNPASADGVPMSIGRWQVVEAPTDWQPDFRSATFSGRALYARDGDIVDLVVLRYDTQRQDAELANTENTVADRDVWYFGQTVKREVNLAGEMIPLRETVIYTDRQRRIVWSFAEVNGQAAGSDLEIKWKEAMSLMTFRLPVSAAILISVPVKDDTDQARLVLEAFTVEFWEGIHRCLYALGSVDAACRSTDAP